MPLRFRIFFFVTAGILIWMFVHTAQEKAIDAVAEKFHLSGVGREYIAVCKYSLNTTRQEFSSGRDTLDGCGCVARQVTDKHGDNMELAIGIMENAINKTHDDDAGLPSIEYLANLIMEHGEGAMDVYTTTLRSISSCNH